MKETLRSLLALIILAGFLELLLPEDEMRKYSRMVLGLLVLFSLLQLIVSAGKEFSLEILNADPSLYDQNSVASLDRLLATGQRVQEAGAEKAESARQERLTKQVNTVVQQICAGYEVRTELAISDGVLTMVRVYLEGTDTERPIEVVKIKKAVGELLMISPDLVEVEKTVEGSR
ncbi:MAG TPA: hypothetical protein GXZ36_08205 [Firmicutes bacterium]|nr:hypothetical protein [Bacillota bacterium]